MSDTLSTNQQRVQHLIARGAHIPVPESVEIGPEVDLERIQSEGLYLGSGSRLLGEKTFVGKGVRIGTQGPVVSVDCQLAPEAVLASGTFEGATFLSAARMGSNAQVRAGTLIEEQASGAHCVGLKQTILFPYVTLGSLINFCDILMTGGTSRKNHSEVGSSYIHFNFTAHQDKATASLLGDVAHGVMLNQDPIFLGGQGGLVGPRRLAFGTVSAAGTMVRKDELRPNRLLFGSDGRRTSAPYKAGDFYGLKRIFQNNCTFIANLLALRAWYRQVRCLFVGAQLPQPVHAGALDKLEMALDERIKRLHQLAGKVHEAYHTAQPQSQDLSLYNHWPALAEAFQCIRQASFFVAAPQGFLQALENQITIHGPDYLAVMHALDTAFRETGSQWLAAGIDASLGRIWEAVPDMAPLIKE